MQARDIAIKVPTVTRDDSIAHAIQVMALGRLPGLIVVDEADRPRLVLPGTQVLRLAVPVAYQEDQALTRTVDEAHADVFWHEIRDMKVGDCLGTHTPRPVIVKSSATLLELATLMARQRAPRRSGGRRRTPHRRGHPRPAAVGTGADQARRLTRGPAAARRHVATRRTVAAGVVR